MFYLIQNWPGFKKSHHLLINKLKNVDIFMKNSIKNKIDGIIKEISKIF